MFENEVTFVRMAKAGKEDEFHRLYEEALKEVPKYLGKEYPNLLAGEVKEAKKLTETSPVDGKELATFQLSSEESLEKALKMLNSSYRKWYGKGYLHRAKVMLKVADKISEKKYLFSALLAYENGKNRAEAMADVDEGIDFLRYYALHMIENNGFEHLTGKGYDNEESFSVMKPYGVFAVIPPFNFYAITVGMVAGPLTVGNAVLLKPSSDIPLISYLTVKLMHECGVPEDVLVYLSGSGSTIGSKIVEHDGVAGIVFTGSREVGLNMYHKAQSKRPKPVITEMGGKDAVIVTAKADMKKAVEGVFRGAYGFSGQKCSATSLVYAEESIYDKFVDALVERTKGVVPSDPKKKDTFLGPVINKDAFEKFKSLAPKFSQYGKVVAGGHALEQPGFYVEPTIIRDVPKDCELVKNELFLPVLGVIKVKNLKEAVEEVNKSEYGLTGGIVTEDPEEIRYYFDNADVGVIYANRERGASTGAVVGSQPFVGWKMSGISGKGTGSYYYLQQFLREQSQTIAH